MTASPRRSAEKLRPDLHRKPAGIVDGQGGQSSGNAVAKPARSPQQSEGVHHIRAEGAVLLYFLANSGKVCFQETQPGVASGAGALAFRHRVAAVHHCKADLGMAFPDARHVRVD